VFVKILNGKLLKIAMLKIIQAMTVQKKRETILMGMNLIIVIQFSAIINRRRNRIAAKKETKRMTRMKMITPFKCLRKACYTDSLGFFF
jgi:hypothetical protein